MKTSKLIILACIFISCLNMNAQECYTPSPEPPSWILNSALRSSMASSYSPPYTLRIFVHIIRSSNGSGLGATIVNTILSSLNSAYNGTGIQFQLTGYEFVNNDTYYINLSDAEITSLFTLNSHNDAIDIYVLGTSTTGMTSGVAAGIPATAYIVHGSRYNTTTIPHEMGHCLGLYHTHHGTVNEGGQDYQACTELVNGSNSTTCGDYIADTPADPRYWDYCTYVGNSYGLKDANNQSYNPNPANYMAYSYYTCRNMFTPQQIQRMKDFITYTPILQNVVVIPSLSGATSICPGSVATYSVANLPAGASVVWSKSGSYLSWVSISGASATVTSTNTGLSHPQNIGRIGAAIILNADTIAKVSKYVDTGYVTASISGANTLNYLQTNTYTRVLPSSGCLPPGTFRWRLDGSLVGTGVSIAIESVAAGTTPSPSPSPAAARALALPPGGSTPVSTHTLTLEVLTDGGATLTMDTKTITIYGGHVVHGTYTSYAAQKQTLSMLYSNPVGNDLTVVFEESRSAAGTAAYTATVQNAAIEVILYDAYGQTLRKTVSSGKPVQFDVSDLKNGMYYLHVRDKNDAKAEPIRKTVIVKH